MIILFLILLTLAGIGVGTLLILYSQLDKQIAELEKTISTLQYQTDDFLCDINIVNENALNTYELLNRTEDENEKIN